MRQPQRRAEAVRGRATRVHAAGVVINNIANYNVIVIVILMLFIIIISTIIIIITSIINNH